MSLKTVQAIINGVTTTLTLNSTTGKYEATITAPNKSSYNQDGHFYNVTVKATDVAGNVTTKDATDATLGNSLKLVVIEKTAPTLAFTYPSAGALITNNKPVITWQVRDTDSGVDPDTIAITVDNGSKVTIGIIKTRVNNGYDCSYTPTTALSDGSHTIKLDASDFDGNVATQKTVTFKIDTVPPTLNVTKPAEGLITNAANAVVEGTTNDATSSPVKVTVKLNSGTAENVTVTSTGTFTKSLTLVEGNNIITITATDSAGKSTTVTRTVVLDTIAPTITSVSMIPNPVDAGQTYIITVNVTD